MQHTQRRNRAARLSSGSTSVCLKNCWPAQPIVYCFPQRHCGLGRVIRCSSKTSGSDEHGGTHDVITTRHNQVRCTDTQLYDTLLGQLLKVSTADASACIRTSSRASDPYPLPAARCPLFRAPQSPHGPPRTPPHNHPKTNSPLLLPYRSVVLCLCVCVALRSARQHQGRQPSRTRPIKRLQATVVGRHGRRLLPTFDCQRCSVPANRQTHQVSAGRGAQDGAIASTHQS